MKLFWTFVITSLISLSAFAANNNISYASASVLANGKFVKIRISESGVYKLTYEDLQEMGILPENVRIFGYGGAMLSQRFSEPRLDDLPEVAIWMNKGSDGVFNSGDYVLFYAQGVNKWTYSEADQMFSHRVNPYSFYGYYFVTSDAGTGKKITDAAEIIPSGTVHNVNEFVDYQVHEVESSSLLNSGQRFYGEQFSTKTAYDFYFTFPNALSTTKMKVDVAASNASTFTIKLNGGQSKTLSVPASSSIDVFRKATLIDNFTSTSDNFLVSINYSRASNSYIGYLNYIELNVRRRLSMSGSDMQFQNVDNLGTESFNTYSLSNANSNVVIWDITEKENITKIPVARNGQTLTFSSSNQTLRQYLAIDPTADFSKPDVVGEIGNQNLHGLSNVDMVILTHPRFYSEAQKLSEAHKQYDNLNVAIVTTEQVYNEFSSGTPDASAYRWLMKMIYDRDPENTKYLLLFGRGSFDNRGITSGTSDNNLILTYQAENSTNTDSSYVTDDYFGIMTTTGGVNIQSDKIAIALGRFPVTTTEEAQSVVNKTISYMRNSDRGSWKNQTMFVGDDGDGNIHMRSADVVANIVAQNHPAYQINKIYLDAFQQVETASGQSYPEAKSKLLNKINSGLFYLNYMGHASSNGWSNEAVLSASDIQLLSNKRHFLCFAGTCDFVQFDVGKISAGEYLLTNPIGGAIGVLSASRVVYTLQNETLNRYFTAALFDENNGQHDAIGEVLVIAKNRANDLNKLPYVYFGDPALKMTYPTKYNVKTVQINDNTNLQGADTLKALSVNTIRGIVTDKDGNTITDFNGNVAVTIYDKEQTVSTLNNDKIANTAVFQFKDRPNVVFSGRTTVENGAFSITFMMPKDIRHNYGTARINYYAEQDSVTEAQGYFENLLIGGSSNDIIEDNEGPDINVVYLNTPDFRNGDKTHETPYFVAHVSDKNGINTAGSGIGHDLLLTIDKSADKAYILNDYFTSDFNSYTSGTIAYTMPELSNGSHQLTFKVWDLLNNSSSVSLDFVVEKGLSPVIASVINYPNPASTSTIFKIIHDRPQDILSVTLEIFDLMGRKVWDFTQATTETITWDLTTADGVSLRPGMYLYRVNMKTATSGYCTKTNKLIVTGK